MERIQGGGDEDGLSEEWRDFEASKHYFEVGQCYKFVVFYSFLFGFKAICNTCDLLDIFIFIYLYIYIFFFGKAEYIGNRLSNIF